MLTNKKNALLISDYVWNKLVHEQFDRVFQTRDFSDRPIRRYLELFFDKKIRSNSLNINKHL